jgi:hypothetical protein
MPVGRLFLSAWLAVFALQSADAFTLLVPDDCGLLSSERRSSDPCPDGCARCVCCARTALPSLSPTLARGDDVMTDAPLFFVGPPGSAHPPGIFHVPKAL